MACVSLLALMLVGTKGGSCDGGSRAPISLHSSTFKQQTKPPKLWGLLKLSGERTMCPPQLWIFLLTPRLKSRLLTQIK